MMMSNVRLNLVHSYRLAILALGVTVSCSAQHLGTAKMVSNKQIAEQFLQLPERKLYEYDEDIQVDLMDRISDLEFTGLAINAPKSIDASKNAELPLLVVSQFDAMRGWRVDLKKNCIVLVVHLESGTVRAGSAFVDEKLRYSRGSTPQEPPEPMPEGDAATAISTGVFWLNLKKLLDGPWQSGSYAISVVSLDFMSNTVVVELDSEEEPEEATSDELAGREVIPPTGGSPPTAVYTQVTNSPELPAIGARISMTREHSAPVTSLPVHGAFAVAAREQYVLSDDERAQQLEKTGTPVSAVVPITLVAVGMDWAQPVLGNWQVPVYSQAPTLPQGGSLQGYFNVDVAAVDEEMRLDAGYYAIYALLEDTVAGPAQLVVK